MLNLGLYKELPMPHLFKIQAKQGPAGTTSADVFTRRVNSRGHQIAPSVRHPTLNHAMAHIKKSGGKLYEDTTVGSGAIAGVGIGPDGEPPVRNIKKRNKTSTTPRKIMSFADFSKGS